MRVLLSLCMALMAGTAGAAQAPQNLISNGDFAAGLADWRVTEDETCRPAVVSAGVGGYSRALRLALRPTAGATPWSISLRQSVDSALDKDGRLQLRVWMRSPESCRVAACVELGKTPYTKSMQQTFTLTPEWKEYQLAGKCQQAFAPGTADLVFHLGYGAGTVEMVGIRLLDLDTPTDLGERATLAKPVALVRNGDFSQGTDGWSGSAPERLKVTVVDAAVGEYRRAVRLESFPEAQADPWSVQFGQQCVAPVRKGDAVYFRAWMRSPDRCRVGFIYEMAAPPNTKSISQMVLLTPEWKEYRFVGRAQQHFRAEESQAKFFLGYSKGVVEVAGVRVENYGEAAGHTFSQTIDYWGGRAHPDTWRQSALERIEQIRKGDLRIRVVDAQGRPVPDAQVRVEQKRHHFRFGSAVPAARLLDSSPDSLRLQQEVSRLYNTVTFENDLKWPSMNPVGLSRVDRAVEWLRAREIDVRSHCLLWGSYKYVHGDARELRGPALLDAMRQHVADYGARMKGRTYLWDVVNEAATNTEVWENVGWEHFADAFRRARAADPTARLCYNDYGIVNENPAHRKKAAARIRYLLEQGAPVDVLGIQAHMSTPLTPIHRVLEILDEWAAFGKDLEITEFDLGCADDAVHGDYVRDFMIATFSHPKVTAFIQWGFWEGAHWRAKDSGMMFRRDWSKRPAQEAYEDLVLRQWWTRWGGKTDVKGGAALRAFYGRHEVTVERGGKRATAVVNLVPGAAGTVDVVLR